MRKVMDAGAALMNERERQVMVASAPRNLMALSRRELQRMVKRARDMMGRYALRSQQVRRVAPGTRIPLRGRKVEGEMNTRRKAAMFRTALARFELQLGRMTKAALRKARPAMRTPVVGKATRAMPSRMKTVKMTRMARVAAPRTKPVKAMRMNHRVMPLRTKTAMTTRTTRVVTPRTKNTMATRMARATPPRTKTAMTTRMDRAATPRTKNTMATRMARATPPRTRNAMTRPMIRAATPRTKTAMTTRTTRVAAPRTKTTMETRMARATPPRTKPLKATRGTTRITPPHKNRATPTVRPAGYTRRTLARAGMPKAQRIPVMNPRDL
ncbi:hypothetical protein D7V97_09160 [Corallococcus sp. CA053C]|uniref:hypothetical protein n=1 Tax=Corallococcus sp. CA053C TaxID=2316732 RepID=UPI000EA10F16|nr:hypothetical protein [Corallococcus sp. CA053C]RKH12194.1 hypothetical protein D7V97_09160 [Corallococcus sp. CA053C]